MHQYKQGMNGGDQRLQVQYNKVNQLQSSHTRQVKPTPGAVVPREGREGRTSPRGLTVCCLLHLLMLCMFWCVICTQFCSLKCQPIGVDLLRCSCFLRTLLPCCLLRWHIKKWHVYTDTWHAEHLVPACCRIQFVSHLMKHLFVSHTHTSHPSTKYNNKSFLLLLRILSICGWIPVNPPQRFFC